MNSWPLNAEDFRASTERQSVFDPSAHLKGDLLFPEVERLGNKAYDTIHAPNYAGSTATRRFKLQGQKWYMRGMLCMRLVTPRYPGGPNAYALYMTPDGDLCLFETAAASDSLHIGEHPERIIRIDSSTPQFELEIARRLLIIFLETNAAETSTSRA